MWQTIISVGHREPMVYKYAIVDDDDVVLLAETLTRRIVFPSQLAEDSVVKIFDVWQVCGFRGMGLVGGGMGWWCMLCFL